jgi:hypothetical protein
MMTWQTLQGGIREEVTAEPLHVDAFTCWETCSIGRSSLQVPILVPLMLAEQKGFMWYMPRVMMKLPFCVSHPILLWCLVIDYNQR